MSTLAQFGAAITAPQVDNPITFRTNVRFKWLNEHQLFFFQQVPNGESVIIQNSLFPLRKQTRYSCRTFVGPPVSICYVHRRYFLFTSSSTKARVWPRIKYSLRFTSFSPLMRGFTHVSVGDVEQEQHCACSNEQPQDDGVPPLAQVDPLHEAVDHGEAVVVVVKDVHKFAHPNFGRKTSQTVPLCPGRFRLRRLERTSNWCVYRAHVASEFVCFFCRGRANIRAPSFDWKDSGRMQRLAEFLSTNCLPPVS